MVELFLIRHGKTYGNTLGRYIGTTDEELCAEGREALVRTDMGRTVLTEPLDAVYVSPMKRCIQTAGLLFPDCRPIFCPELRECDFGEFENKNYRELSENAAYQAWIDSGGTLPFPGGESREEFESRCLLGFGKVLEDIRERCGSQKMRRKAAETKNQVSGADICFRAALVVHGGTIMSILSAYAFPPEDFYHWQIKNAEGFRALWDETDKGGICLYEISHIGSDSGDSA